MGAFDPAVRTQAERALPRLAPRLHVQSANDVPFGYMVAMMFGILLVVAFIPRIVAICSYCGSENARRAARDAPPAR